MSDELEIVGAELFININVTCPNDECGTTIDLLDPYDTDGYEHNDESKLLNIACPSDGLWSDSHQTFVVRGVTCTNCKTKFRVETIVW